MIIARLQPKKEREKKNYRERRLITTDTTNIKRIRQ